MPARWLDREYENKSSLAVCFGMIDEISVRTNYSERPFMGC
jgi:hypothetical protein